MKDSRFFNNNAPFWYESYPYLYRCQMKHIKAATYEYVHAIPFTVVFCYLQKKKNIISL